jgi:hypothetical protein
MVLEEQQPRQLHEVERFVMAQLLELGRLLLLCFLERKCGSRPRSVRVGAVDLPCHSIKTVGYRSLFGDLRINRPYYWKENAGEGVCPLDRELNLPARTYSYLLQEACALFDVRGSYEKGMQMLEKLFGVTLWKQGAELVVRDCGADVQAFYKEQKPPTAESEGAILVVSPDGKGVPMRKPEKVKKTLRRGSGIKRNKKRMAVVTAIYTVEPRPRTPESVVASLFDERPPDRRIDPVVPKNKRIRAKLGEAADAFKEVERQIAERRPETKRDRVLLMDAEKRMIEKGALPMFDSFTKILDFVHVAQRVWDAGVALLGERNAHDWVRARCLSILQGKSRQVTGEIRRVAANSDRTVAGILATVARYFDANHERMRYDEYLARGLPIATGVVEGACCTLVKQRMEGPGMRWGEVGAQAMLELRAVDQNGDWEGYWRWFTASERTRLYGSRRVA